MVWALHNVRLSDCYFLDCLALWMGELGGKLQMPAFACLLARMHGLMSILRDRVPVLFESGRDELCNWPSLMPSPASFT